MELLPGFTSLEEQEAEIERLRKLTPAERFAISAKLSWEAMEAVKAEILKEYPDESEEERKLIFVERYYGKDLADRVRVYLQKRAEMKSDDSLPIDS